MLLVVPQIQTYESEAAVKAIKRKKMTTQTQRHEERKRQRLSAEERKREGEKERQSIILDKQDQKKILADMKEKTQKDC